MKTYRYRVYGISVDSEMELPELFPVEADEPDVSIRYGDVLTQLPEVKTSGVLYQAAPLDFLLRLKNVGAFRVQKGNSITIEPAAHSLPEEIRLFLLGSVMGALLHQRGMLPIHGGAIAIKDGALIITGNSAVGKSTLVATLAERGFPFLTDDIAVIESDEKEILQLHPGIPQLKLWKDV